jgi:ATP-binding protein involved in chromosome partitioning
MRIAIPLAGEKLSSHFGHSEHFLLVDADMDQRTVLHKQIEKAPEHAPGVLPAWLADHQVDVVIAAGLGARARDLLAARSVQVLSGVSDSDPDSLVADFFSGSLKSGASICDHSHHNCGH